MAKLKFKRALHHTVPSACDGSYEPVDKVLLWPEYVVANQIGEWIEPYEV